MKRLIYMLLCAVLLFCLPGCGTPQPEAPPAQVVNPVREVESTDAFLELDILLPAPEDVENCRFSVISDEIAQIQYSAGEIEYTLRAGNTEEDISGVHAEFIQYDCGVLLQHRSGEYSIWVHYTTDGGGLAKWQIDKTRYSLYAPALPEHNGFDMYAAAIARNILNILYPYQGSDAPLTVTSGGQTFEPYAESVYSMTWYNGGFLCADGGIDLPGIWDGRSYTGLLPEIPLREDLELTCGFDAELRRIRIYDRELTLLGEHSGGADCFHQLEPGTYCVEVEVCQYGPYIEQEDERLYTGYACVFMLIVS